jgi:hypothetical protein
MSAAHRDGLNLTECIVDAPYYVLVKLKHQENCMALHLYKNSDHLSLHTYFIRAIVSVVNCSQLVTFRHAGLVFSNKLGMACSGEMK